MTGLSKNVIKTLNKVLSADAELESINVDYDSLTMQITESTGTRKQIICDGYIGYDAIGFWNRTGI